jgi:hypothetical protein
VAQERASIKGAVRIASAYVTGASRSARVAAAPAMRPLPHPSFAASMQESTSGVPSCRIGAMGAPAA